MGNLVGKLKGADQSVFETKGSLGDDKKITNQYKLDRYRILHLVLHATPHLTLTDYCHFKNKCPS
ncbi:hypothetical protein CROQUDRAFT_659100 [Cronartium quercuum f. sp. fusiforme G11]|uniref:Uncharacterized protein n=1 Tax=Cronartium quercuum f. sp. fusiforme G11 TaxID=708437 RepID=A0A9P6TB03_9BASI|nr:hypothetical protein CROQUDRAFT_659100 [Cronartium quercuum f. sp. fusiforme G11]